MGKTVRRDQQFRSRKQGRVFTKDSDWKTRKNRKNSKEWAKTPGNSVTRDDIFGV
jgi:hypothetical protein